VPSTRFGEHKATAPSVRIAQGSIGQDAQSKDVLFAGPVGGPHARAPRRGAEQRAEAGGRCGWRSHVRGTVAGKPALTGGHDSEQTDNHAQKHARQAARHHPGTLAGAPRQPPAAHAVHRPRAAGRPAAGPRLAAGRRDRADRGTAGAGRIQPAAAGVGRARPAGAVGGAGGSAVVALPVFPAGARPVAGTPAAGAQPQRERIPLGLRAGAAQRPRRRRAGLAGTHRLPRIAAPATGRAGKRPAGLPVPPRKRSRRRLAGRPAPAPAARRRPRHPDRHTQVPGQPSARPGLDTVLGLCERHP